MKSAGLPEPGRTRFTTELRVRPDDIDMNWHVHGSRYFDYVLAARYDQMARCYGMAMEEFLKLGLGWYTQASYFEYKRPLVLGDTFAVTTWVDAFARKGVRVRFEMHRGNPAKLACSGWCDYTLVSLENGRAQAIPGWIAQKYAV
jgi:acyl-CoA thioester hydrolase/thioesterase-3